MEQPRLALRLEVRLRSLLLQPAPCRRATPTRLLAGWGLLFLLAGCEVFSTPPSLFKVAEKGLPALKPPPDSIQLEIVFAERPRGDKLLGEVLWRDVDQILGLDPELARDLEKNGFRVGVVASQPPVALQSILGLRSDAPEPGATAAPQISGNRLFIRSGTTSEIIVSPTYPSCDMTLWPSYLSEQGDVKLFQNARCQFRVTATRAQEGWARLEFVPEVQHGEERMRPNAGQQDWQLLASQEAEKLFNQRFTVMLNVGEMALITCQDHAPHTAGHRFFTGPEGEDEVQRLLLVRLAHMGDGAGTGEPR